MRASLSCANGASYTCANSVRLCGANSVVCTVLPSCSHCYHVIISGRYEVTTRTTVIHYNVLHKVVIRLIVILLIVIYIEVLNPFDLNNMPTLGSSRERNFVDLFSLPFCVTLSLYD